VTRHALIQVLANEGKLEGPDRADLITLSGLLAHIFHFLFHQEARALTRDYSPFDPDAVAQPTRPLTATEKERRAARFVKRFEHVLKRANYHELDEDEMNELLNQRSPWALKLRVDLSQFKQFCLYYRGNGEEERSIRDWSTLYRKRTVRYPVFRRMALLAQFRESVDLPAVVSSRFIYLKLFKNIPRTDLEMLFPNTIPEMKILDRIKVFAPLIGGTGTTIIKIIGAAAISVFAAMMIAAAFIGYAIKTFFGFLRVKEQYQGTLVSNLYFNSLDNNAGVIHHLINQAEEEEVKEALLAYYFLLSDSESRRDALTLDRHIERFLEERFEVKMNFEAPDALDKLKLLELLEEAEDGRLEVLPLRKALCRLDQAWDNYFTFSDEDDT
jgi:hypothetical protein